MTASGTYEPGWWERRLPVYARRNTALLAYVAAVVVGGVALLALRGASVAELATVPFLVWLIISVAAELLWLETLAGDGTDSMASTVNFAVIFLLAPGLALWVIGVSVALATRLIQRRDWLRSLFGLGQIVITAFLAERAFHLLHPGELAMGSFGTRGALAMLAGGTVYFFVNTWLVAGAVSLERRVPLRTTWIQNYGYRNSVVSSVALFTLSPVLVLSYLSIGYAGIIIYFLPLMIIKNQNREYINLQKMTQALISSERMAAKGEMAAEVAHEINNYLAVLSGRTQLLLLRAGRAGDEAMRADADIIRRQITRMSTLAKGLLDFSHKDLHVQPYDLNKLIGDTLEFVRPQNLFDTVSLVTELDPEVAEIQGDPGQIQQVLINLLRNAAEAMRSAPAPTGQAAAGRHAAASDATGQAQAGGEGAGLSPASGPGPDETSPQPTGGHRIVVSTSKGPRGSVRLRVADNGPGMGREVLAKVFEPAFTTKPDGHGYGLATCYRILENHGGRIWATSDPGAGATFSLEFPRKVAAEGGRPAAHPVVASANFASSGGQNATAENSPPGGVDPDSDRSAIRPPSSGNDGEQSC